MFSSLIASMILYINHVQINPAINPLLSYFVSSLIFLTIFIITAIAPMYLLFVRMFWNLPKRRINRIIHNIHLLPFERVIQKLQKEVNLLVSLISTLDAFTNSQTRLVIMVDGLDTCEPTKMVQILDALALFFASRPNTPFIMILAVDPQIIVSGLQNNLRTTVAGSAGVGGEITAEDYIKNIVNMPFYLDHSTLKKLQKNLRPRGMPNGNLASFRERKRSESIVPFARGSLSRLSLRDSQPDILGAPPIEMGTLIPSYDYFSNMNPRIMRRIVNSIALTGRLLRTFEVEFSWFTLYNWISLIEQWPYRMCWLIDASTDPLDDPATLTISELYERCKPDIQADMNNLNSTPFPIPLTHLDRNSGEFEMILRKMSTNKQDQLCVKHIRFFSHCTSNLNPQLKVIVRQRRGVHSLLMDFDSDPIGGTSQAQSNTTNTTKNLIDLEAGAFLFEDSSIWTKSAGNLEANIENGLKPLFKMTIGEIINFLKKLNIEQKKLSAYIDLFYLNNLNGLVLQTCDLEDLKNALNASLGDWTLIKLLIETLRKWDLSYTPQPQVQQPKSKAGEEALQYINQEDSQKSLLNQKNLGSIQEEGIADGVPEVDDPNFGLVATDEMPSVNNAETNDFYLNKQQQNSEESDEESTADSDSTKSVIGSNQSLLFRPGR